MTVKVKFYSNFKELEMSLPPVPASKFWPEWFKNQRPIIDGNDQQYASTVRKCPAILDILSTGYIIPLWSDFKLKRTNKNEMGYLMPPAASELFGGITTHAKPQIDNYPFDNDTFPGSVKFMNPWGIVTPPGYSCMFVSPYYHSHPHIRAMNGIIETDRYHEAHINTFFNAKINEEIELKRGMPLVQVIPFKREEYEMETITGDGRSWISKIRDFVSDTQFLGDVKRYRDELYTKRYK